MDIKEPAFDKPSGLGIVRERDMVDPHTVPITVGMKVVLVYKGKQMTATVTAIEEPNSRFLGRVEVFDGTDLRCDDLQHEDIFRFHRRDLRWIG